MATSARSKTVGVGLAPRISEPLWRDVILRSRGPGGPVPKRASEPSAPWIVVAVDDPGEGLEVDRVRCWVFARLHVDHLNGGIHDDACSLQLGSPNAACLEPFWKLEKSETFQQAKERGVLRPRVRLAIACSDQRSLQHDPRPDLGRSLEAKVLVASVRTLVGLQLDEEETASVPGNGRVVDLPRLRTRLLRRPRGFRDRRTEHSMCQRKLGNEALVEFRSEVGFERLVEIERKEDVGASFQLVGRKMAPLIEAVEETRRVHSGRSGTNRRVLDEVRGSGAKAT